MKRLIIDLIGPTGFERLIELLGLGLPVAILVVMIWLGMRGLPFLPIPYHDDVKPDDGSESVDMSDTPSD